MADSSDIILNPDVLDGKQGGEIPLSDLYGMPVFRSDMQEQFEDADAEEDRELQEIRGQIFAPHTDAAAEDLTEIREQLFEIEPPLTKNNASRQAQAGIGKGAVLIIEAMALVFLVILLFYQRYRQKKRRKIQDDAHDNGK